MDERPRRRLDDWVRIIERETDAVLRELPPVKEPETALDALERCREAWTKVHMQMSLEV